MYNISFFQILIFLVLIFLMFGDTKKMSKNIQKVKNSFFKKDSTNKK